MMNKKLLKDGTSEFQEDFTLQLLIYWFILILQNLFSNTDIEN